MKAINTIYHADSTTTVVHNNVVELPKMSANRSFKCTDCGLEWIEGIHSPMIVTDEELSYVQNKINCNEKNRSR